jgi:hypothetical protein
VSVLLVWPNSQIEVRRIPIEGYLVGSERVLDLELLATTASVECRLAVVEAAYATWLHVSDDAGASWHDVPALCAEGYQLGPLSESQRKIIKLKLLVPEETEIRTRSIGLKIGLGDGGEILPGWLPATEVFDGGLFTDPDAGEPAAIDKGTF